MAEADPPRRRVDLVLRTRQRLRDWRGALTAAAGPPPVTLEAIPFQSDFEEVMEERPPRFLRSTLYLVIGMVVCGLTVSAVCKVDMIIKAPGRLAADVPLIVLQPLQPSIIRTLHVRAGDSVKQGQVLATLDPTFTEADVTSVSAQLASLQAQEARLEAEVAGRPFAPAANRGSAYALQLSLYQQRQAQYAAHLESAEEDIRQREASYRTTQATGAQLARALAVARDVETIRASLFHGQVGSRLEYLEAQANRMTTERDFQDASNRLLEISHDIQGRRAARQSFIDEWRRNTLDDLVRTRTDLARMHEELTKADRMNDLVVITAPADAVVLEVAPLSVGSVVRQAETLVTLLPASAGLMADIALASADVGYTTVNSDVVVKVDAFPYMRHGALMGRLRSISEESFAAGSPPRQDGSAPPAPAGGAYHRGEVTFASTALKHLPAGARLIPGMTITAEIKVGERSILSYFLFPLTHDLEQSFREP
jgi:HlyD family secretion protein